MRGQGTCGGRVRLRAQLLRGNILARVSRPSQLHVLSRTNMMCDASSPRSPFRDISNKENLTAKDVQTKLPAITVEQVIISLSRQIRI